MVQVEIILKSGTSLVVECEEMKVQKDGSNDLVGLTTVNGKKNSPYYIRLDEVAAILRIK